MDGSALAAVGCSERSGCGCGAAGRMTSRAGWRDGSSIPSPARSPLSPARRRPQPSRIQTAPRRPQRPGNGLALVQDLDHVSRGARRGGVGWPGGFGGVWRWVIPHPSSPTSDLSGSHRSWPESRCVLPAPGIWPRVPDGRPGRQACAETKAPGSTTVPGVRGVGRFGLVLVARAVGSLRADLTEGVPLEVERLCGARAGISPASAPRVRPERRVTGGALPLSGSVKLPGVCGSRPGSRTPLPSVMSRRGSPGPPAVRMRRRASRTYPSRSGRAIR